MKIEFDAPALEKLAFDEQFIGEWDWRIKKKYQKVIVAFQAIERRESLFRMAGMNFEALAGKRKKVRNRKYPKEYSVRLDRKWRVVLTFLGQRDDETILVIDVEDYHS